MIEATIAIPHSDELAALLDAEATTFAHARATYAVRKEKGSVTVSIRAQDATALKAAVGSLCRVLAVHEKACAI